MRTKIIILVCFISGIFISCNDDETIERIDADFKSDIQNISEGQTVSFKDLSIGSVSKWDWTFEGGTPPTSTLQNPTVTYNSKGVYKVTLKASSAGDSVSLTKESFIVVAAADVAADFETATTNPTQGDNVVFLDKSTGSPNAWTWEFIPSAGGTTLTSTDQNPIITFDIPGFYSVKLTASNDDNSNQKVLADYIEVIDASTVEADFSASSSYSGSSVTFTDMTVGSVISWAWTFEGGIPATSTEQNPTVVYANPGRYKVTLVSTNNFASSTTEKEGYMLIVPADGLAAFLPLDGDSADQGPNSISTTDFGEVSYVGTDRKNAENRAVVLDGASSIIIPDNANLNFGTNDFSVGVWLKTSETKKMMVWQESGANAGGDNQTWLRMGDNTTDRIFRFAAEDSSGGKIINVGDDETNPGSDDLWHYVVCTREGLITTVYVDGSFVASLDTGVIKEVSNEQDFKIGCQEGPVEAYKTFFTGSLDELVIYNKALSIEEISVLYNL